MLPRSSVPHPAIGALATVTLFACVADSPLLVAVLFACWLATAFHSKHLLGTTYRQGRLPGRWFNLGSRVVWLVALVWPCSCVVGGGLWFCVGLALYSYSFLDGGEWTGGRSLRGSVGWTAVMDWSRLAAGYARLLGGPCATIADGPPLQSPCILCMHPHGLFPFGTNHNLGMSRGGLTSASVFPGARSLVVAVASFCFYIPGLREVLLAFGVVDASRPVLAAQLKAGGSVALWPGGASEAAFSGPARAALVLRKRRGFLELALEHGAALVPCYTFGDNSWFRSVEPSWCPRLAAAFQRTTGLLFPSAVPTWPPTHWRGAVTVVGTPLHVERRGPGGYGVVDVDALQQRYMEALQSLYAKHRPLHSAAGREAPAQVEFVS